MALCTPFDRSLAFSCLLTMSPEFGRLTTDEGSQMVTEAVEAWQASDSTDMYAFLQQWLADREGGE